MGGKKVPDLRRGYSFDTPPPAEEEFNKIAATHGFTNPSLVAKKLQFQWEWWQGDIQMGPSPTGSEIKKYLAQTAKLADELEEALVRGGGLGPRLLSEAIPRATLDTWLLLKQLPKLSLAAKIAARAVVESKTGPRFQRERNNLIAKLWAIWLEENPTKVRITQADGYSGKFFQFVVGVFELFGITGVSNKALGKAIEGVQKKTDAQNAAR